VRHLLWAPPPSGSLPPGASAPQLLLACGAGGLIAGWRVSHACSAEAGGVTVAVEPAGSLQLLPPPGERATALARDGSAPPCRLLVGSSSGHLAAWSIAPGLWLPGGSLPLATQLDGTWAVSSSQAAVTCLAGFERGRLLAVGCGDGELGLWAAATAGSGGTASPLTLVGVFGGHTWELGDAGSWQGGAARSVAAAAPLPAAGSSAAAGSDQASGAAAQPPGSPAAAAGGDETPGCHLQRLVRERLQRRHSLWAVPTAAQAYSLLATGA
jgi:hypothetical protein